MLLTCLQLYAIDIFKTKTKASNKLLEFASNKQEKRIVLTIYSVIFFRIWPGDEFGISPIHLTQWIHYMRYAGISQIHLYDNCYIESECQAGLAAQENVDSYTRWSNTDYATAQRSAYADSIKRFHSSSNTTHNNIWLLHHDIDEYPFAPQDREPGFLLRFMTSKPWSKNNDDVRQILLQCMFFGQNNQRLNGSNVLLINAYHYRMPETEGWKVRTKPLFRPDSVQQTSPNIVHEMLMVQGETLDISPSVLRMNHYWGYRLQKEKNELVHDSSISYIADKIYPRQTGYNTFSIQTEGNI